MDWVTSIESALAGACLMLALMHLVMWFRDRSLWANLWFFVAVLGLVGLMACEMVTMHARTPETYARGLQYAQLANLANTLGILGFVHCHFGTGRKGLLRLTVVLQVAAVVADFTTGQSLGVTEVRRLAQMDFLGETVSILGEWEPNRWMLLGQATSLVMVIYIADASWWLWRKGTSDARVRAAAVGGSLIFFIGVGTILAGVVKMPFLVSLPFLGMLLVMGGELSRKILENKRFVPTSVTDVTGRENAERESVRQQQELAHLSRISILGELAGALAHELNQPLAAILGNAQVGRGSLGGKSPDLTEMAAILDDIVDDAKRAGGIIHGMRAMFKKDAVTEPVPMDLNESVTQVLHLLHSEIIGRKVRLVTSLAADLPPVNAGRVEVQQVLINLVMNGLDSMRGMTPGGLLEITSTRVEDRIQVTVRDSGPGIGEDMMEGLFEPFVSSKPGGLGLGLAISRSIVLRFHGELGGGNHPDGGAVFILTLPIAGAEA